jgi:hypothetical protein
MGGNMQSVSAGTANPRDTAELVQNLSNLYSQTQKFYEAARLTCLEIKKFVVTQSDFVKKNDAVLHQVMMIVFGFNLLLLGGVPAMFTFSVGLIAGGAFSEKIKEVVEKISFIWETRSAKLFFGALGIVLFASSPWFFAAGAYGVYLAYLVNQKSQQENVNAQKDMEVSALAAEGSEKTK